MPPRCSQCRAELDVMRRADARYCTDQCRVAAHRQRNRQPFEPPKAMRRAHRWIRYDGRKRPRQINGRFAKSNDPRTWSSYRMASRSTVGVGVGFVLNGDGIVCIDLDHCVLPDRRRTPLARRALELAGDTYCERSMSGEGVHIFGWYRGGLFDVEGGSRDDSRGVEVYGDRRYIAVTGDVVRGKPVRLGDITELVDWLVG